MPPSSKAKEFADLLAGVGEESHDPQAEIVKDQRDKLVALWSRDPWEFLTGRDVDGTPVYQTKDESDPINPVKPFPDYPYLKAWIEALHAELIRAGGGEKRQCQMVLADKPRQVFLTTATLAFFNWSCMFQKARRWLVSKQTEGEAADLIRDKVRFPCSQMPEWLRTAYGASKRPYIRADYQSGSHMLAVGENAADTEFRGGTSTGGLVDEAAFQKRTKEIVAAARPQASLLVLLTTPHRQPRRD